MRGNSFAQPPAMHVISDAKAGRTHGAFYSENTAFYGNSQFWCVCSVSLRLGRDRSLASHHFAGAPHEGWDAIIYAATHRTAWSVGLAWLSYACATGRGGLINGLLAWKALIPMSRLSFSAFMLQTVVLLSRTMTARDRLIFSHEYLVCSMTI